MEYKRILATGAFAGILIVTLLAMGFGNLGANNNSAESGLPLATQSLDSIAPNSTDAEALQQYSTELEQALRTMQERETTYRTQLDLANQTIVEMQDQLTSPTMNRYSGDDDHEAHDDHDDHEEWHEEHEEYEEYDD